MNNLIRVGLVVCCFILSGESALEAKKKEKEPAAVAPELNAQQRKDLEDCKARAREILVNGGFTQEEAVAGYQTLFQFSMNVISIRRGIQKIADAEGKKQYRRKFGENEASAALALKEKAGEAASAKFVTLMEAEKAARAKSAKGG